MSTKNQSTETHSMENTLPLAGIKVIDLSRVLAGPFCGMTLANLGAEVIKVEDKKGDETRMWGPFTKDMSDSFMALNFNKRGIVADLKTPEGAEIVRQLAAGADVLVENFKTGDMEKFGLGYDTLAEANPGLVYTSIAAFGRKGPRANFPGYETLLQAYSGIMSFTGTPGGEPVRTGVSFLDLTSGLSAALATVVALYRRKETGLGGKVEGSLLQSALGLMLVQLVPYLNNGKLPAKLGSGHASATPYQAFKTADGWVLIAAANQNLWERLARATGLEWMIGEDRFADNPARMAHLEEFLGHLNAAFGQWETAKLVDTCVGAGVPCSPINDLDALMADGQVDALEPFIGLDDPDYGHIRTSNVPFHLTDFGSREIIRPPRLGEHTREVLAELGYGEAAIDALYEKGAVA
ncbi:MAG: CoA transferase [SAR324 cluster bacterium]|nr:CoA transferase [SAR324 cluster bacterium]